MTRAAPIRVLVADDNATFRSALAALIESDADLELAAAAADASDAAKLAGREQPDVALVDVRMPGGGAAAAHGIAARSPGTKVILLSASALPPDGLECEIAGCVAKGAPVGRLVDSVKRAAEGLPLAVEAARSGD